ICEQKNIKIVIDVDPIGNELDKFIISTIMSNLLDNAIEACQKIKNEVPYIRVAIRHINDMIFVKIQNPIYDLPDLKRGILLTTKHNNQQHGWGVKSVESAVKRADGVFRYSCSGGEFVSMVTLFL
ncbi:MAG: ATP-binding protein, partial [Oscillospiraceae bacterium]